MQATLTAHLWFVARARSDVVPLSPAPPPPRPYDARISAVVRGREDGSPLVYLRVPATQVCRKAEDAIGMGRTLVV
jgi:hypothetical protein